MKKIILIIVVAAAALSFSSCKSCNRDKTVYTQETVVETHTARNSLDYHGTYEGTLPTASGEGMKVTIQLSGDNYTRTVEYIGQSTDTKVEEKGKYTWNSEGNTITLVNADKPNQYFVSENQITHLDMDGKRITGNLADMYILKKK